jgi:hypothetical protein
MTPFHIAIFYLACVITGVLVGYHAAAYERRRRQKAAKPVTPDLAAADITPRTMTEMEAILAEHKPHKPPYETPTYNPALGVIPLGRIVESHTFAERTALAHARKAPRDVNAVVTDMSAHQTTLWDIIPAPADLKPAVG